MPSDSPPEASLQQIIEKLDSFTPVSFSKAVAEARSQIKERIAIGDAKVRRHLSYAILGLFGSLNIMTIIVIVWLARLDQQNLVARIMPATTRIIDTRVIISLLGATTVQLGTIAVIMARFVFREPD